MVRDGEMVHLCSFPPQPHLDLRPRASRPPAWFEFRHQRRVVIGCHGPTNDPSNNGLVPVGKGLIKRLKPLQDAGRGPYAAT